MLDIGQSSVSDVRMGTFGTGIRCWDSPGSSRCYCSRTGSTTVASLASGSMVAGLDVALITFLAAFHQHIRIAVP